MPCDSLQARKLANGAVMFYWRYSIGKFSARILIGPYDSVAAPKSLSRTKLGYSIQAALSTPSPEFDVEGELIKDQYLILHGNWHQTNSLNHIRLEYSCN
jgi:hypothetical protein